MLSCEVQDRQEPRSVGHFVSKARSWSDVDHCLMLCSHGKSAGGLFVL